MLRRLLATGALVQRFSRKKKSDIPAKNVLSKKETLAFKTLPTGQNLVGKAAASFTIDGKQHTLHFRDTGIILDGSQSCALTAIGAGATGDDVELGLKEVKADGNKLMITAHAWGETYAITLSDDHLQSIVSDLLQGKATTAETPDGITVEIAPKKF